jgi:hypothetical protein
VKKLIILFFVIGYVSLWANNAIKEEMKQYILDNKLYLNSQWLTMNFYNNSYIPPKEFFEYLSPKIESEIIDKQYFLSKDGRGNPKSELLATLNLLWDKEDNRCRYINRMVFLENIFSDTKYATLINKKYQNCSYENEFINKNANIFYGYMSEGDEESEKYGHSLAYVKFDDEERFINFGVTQIDSNPIIHIFNGFFGYYKSNFSISETKIELNENRDYDNRTLELLPFDTIEKKDKKLFLAQLLHFKYMQNKLNFWYYFPTKNCAYQINSLFEILVQSNRDNFNEFFHGVITPKEVFRFFTKYNKDTTGTVFKYGTF